MFQCLFTKVPFSRSYTCTPTPPEARQDPFACVMFQNVTPECFSVLLFVLNGNLTSGLS